MSPSTPQLTNIQIIMGLERETRDGRSTLERPIDGVSGLAGRLTAILKMQCPLAERAGIEVTRVNPRLKQLRTHTDVQQARI